MGDRLQAALDLARTGGRSAWKQIVLRARELDSSELATLDDALGTRWPDSSRTVDVEWVNSKEHAGLTIARRVEIEGEPPTAAAFQDLCRSERARRITSVALFCPALDMDLVRSLALSLHLPSLREVQLRGPWMDEAAEILASSRLAIERVTFEGSGASDRSVVALANGHGLEALSHLQYHDALVGDEGVSIIAKTERFASLRSLRVSYSQLGPAGAQALAAAKRSLHLTDLDLSLNRVGAGGAEAIFSSGVLTYLTYLNLSENRLGAAGMSAIASSRGLPRLRELRLAHNYDDRLTCFGAHGAHQFAALSWIHGIEDLQLEGNGLGDEGALAIARSGNLPALRELDLSNNELTDAGAIALIETSVLDRLRSLRIEGNDLGAGAEEALVVECDDRDVMLYL